MSPRNVASHILITVAGFVFLGGTAHYFGFSGSVVFVVVAVGIFVASILIPEKNSIRADDNPKSSVL
jgi:amino acid permease